MYVLPYFENTTVTLKDNNTNVNKGNKISNTPPLPILNNPKMFNQNSANKYMVIKPENTANTFLENLENIKKDWTWNNLKGEFLNEFQPKGYSILLKNKLENRRQENLESTTSYVTDIENLMNSRDQNLNEYSKILNEQVLQLNKKTSEKAVIEIAELKSELTERDREFKREINKLSDEIKKMSLFSTIQNKSVNFEDDKYEKVNNSNYSRYDGRGSNYERVINDQGHKRDYRDKSPYPRSENRRNRESSIDRRYNRQITIQR
ncbi:serine/threonine-protein kinase fray2-like [Aphis craccivora]|uniref:Serine/threonine-protein kinase fray2-like n=1 Tax=Aphis craccivora TaxID=307492 RepID=A0A6G0VZV2_APHCR|nr:serine/threonine-protein kinase fray2-like [Aphis craccivora]